MEENLRRCLAWLSLIALVVLGADATAHAKQARQKPNIVVLMTDDQDSASMPQPLRGPRHVVIQTFPIAGGGGAGATTFYAAIRTGRYKYVEWTYGTSEPPLGLSIDGITGARELYDLQRDPYELESRHADPAYRSVMNALRSELQRLKRCRGASCNEPVTLP